MCLFIHTQYTIPTIAVSYVHLRLLKLPLFDHYIKAKFKILFSISIYTVEPKHYDQHYTCLYHHF